MTRRLPASLSLLPALFAAAPASAQWVEPAVPLVTIPGRQVGDLFGWRVRNMGDVNGDGLADIAVAAPFDSLNLGRVSVHTGAGGTELWGKTETATSSIFGFDLAVLDDVDRDGVAEVVASAPFATGSGVVYVCSGRTGAVLKTFTGGATNQTLGYALATGGDFDGDGIKDLAIGDVGDTTTMPGGGRVYIYSGQGFRLIATIDPLPGDFQLGTSLAFIGDVDHDRRDDLAVGSRLATTGSAGRLHVVGWTGSATVFRWSISGVEYGGDIDGNKLRGGGDVNGDGVPDVALDEGLPASRARVFSGATGAVLHTFTDLAADYTGSGVTIVPDLNGDGLADVLTGSPKNGTQSNNNGRIRLRSGRDGRILRQLTHTLADARFGYNVDLLPDRTGDGFPELLVGAPGVSGFTRSMGAVYVIAGEPGIAGWRNYGPGLKGPSGLPTLGFAADPVLGAPANLQIGSRLAAQTVGVLLLGFREVSLPTVWGGTLLVAPAVVVGITVPAGGATVPLAVPADASLSGLPAFLQAMLADVAAPGGVIETPGVRAQLGR